VLLAFVIAIVGRIIDEYSMERYLAIRRYIILLALIVLITLTAQSGAYYLLEKTTTEKLTEFGFSIFLSLVFFVIVVKGTELIFIEEINAKKRWIREYAGKKVVGKDGAEIGKVSKVLLDDSRFAGVKVGRRKIDKENMVYDKGVIVSQT
jgi:hypothetical protein